MSAWTMGEFAMADLGDGRLNKRLIELADRFADKPTASIPSFCACNVEPMRRARDLGHPADWLIRSQHNRCLPDGAKLRAAVLSGEVLGEIEFTLPARHGQITRTVTQQVWARTISLPDGEGGHVSVTCAIAREVGAPAGVKPVEWRLLTNRAVAGCEAVVELIDWYRCRWEIETFFHVLKNGLSSGNTAMGHIGQLELALAVYMVVSWRLARLVRLGRTHPDLDASALFTDEERQGAYILAKKPIPLTAPTIREVIRQIAMLGGFLGRKGDGEPGVKTLWLGLQRVRDFVVGVEYMRGIHAE